MSTLAFGGSFALLPAADAFAVSFGGHFALQPLAEPFNVEFGGTFALLPLEPFEVRFGGSFALEPGSSEASVVLLKIGDGIVEVPRLMKSEIGGGLVDPVSGEPWP